MLLAILGAAVVLPLYAVPVAAMIAPERRLAGAAIVIGFVSAVIAGAFAFAVLAKPIEPAQGGVSVVLWSATGACLAAAFTAASGPARASARLARALSPIVTAIGLIALPCLALMAIAQFCGVILRYVFGLNFISLQEGVTYLHATAFMVAAGWALLRDEHVRVDLFYREASARDKALVDFGGSYLFLLPFSLVLLWASAPYVGASWEILEGSSEQSGIQAQFLLKSLIPAFAILLAIAGFTVASRAAARLREGGK